MGWLEILPLLQKLLPLLSRTVPMLETTLASRANIRSEAAAHRGEAAVALGNNLSELSSGNAAILRRLNEQATQMSALDDSLRKLSLTNSIYADQLRAADERIAALAGWTRAAVLLSAVTLLALLVLLGVMIHIGRTPA